jgi:RNA polymerase sigma factor (sigma-70 family)
VTMTLEPTLEPLTTASMPVDVPVEAGPRAPDPRPDHAADSAELVQRARRGDDRAYEQLVARHQRQVWAAVRGFRLSEADAHDAVQMTWLRLVENLDKLNDPSRVGAWLTTTAKRECLRLIRRRGREVGTPDEFFAAFADDDAAGPEQQVTQDAMAGLLWEFVAELPGKAQELLKVAVGNDRLAYAEISMATGMPIGSIGPTRGRYLTRLRRRLEDAGMPADAWR